MSIHDSIAQKILIVDDEQPICNMLSFALVRARYSVFTATSSQHAFEVMKAEKCLVMFIDFNLPEISGVDLYKAIRAENPDSVAYLMTGWASEEDLYACKAAGFEDCFTKPVSLQVLFKAAQSAFGRMEAVRRPEKAVS
jgi:DNA-binding response OmpR family regulator